MTPPDGYSHALPNPAARRPAPSPQPRTVDPRVAERLEARRRRVAAIRKRVVTIAATVFLALWAMIFVQLVSGHDPALAGKSATTAGTSSASTAGTGSSNTAASSNTASSSNNATSSSNNSSSSSSNSGTTSPVTTSQS